MKLLALLLVLPASGLCSGELDSYIRTPKADAPPRINGPSIYGARPGKPFLYRIPCTGVRPIRFSASGLPSGLSLDANTGTLRGVTPSARGTYRVRLAAANSKGRARRELRIVVGDTLALTPPMGWNDWYTHYDRITDERMRKAADAMIASGMADYGYQYVNIDDCWMMKPGSEDPELNAPPRTADGRIQSNRRFPDMEALADYIHAKGLKAGLYTSPGPTTCARFTGSYGHEEQDARQFAAWGFDFLKYDWCSYGRIAGGKDLPALKRPYEKMGALLKDQSRDILLNLCQYGMGDVWKWGGEVGGHSWRTTGDLGLEKGDRLPGFYRIGLRNAELGEYAGPGRWNDPDYILIGYVGNARSQSEPAQPTTLSADEQYSYMSMWSLMASPLFFSGDMERLDAFTLNVLCNAEVIEVNQDAQGRQARIVRKSEGELVLAKPLEDGSLAVGLFNLSEQPRELRVTWTELSLRGKKTVRDVWRHKNLGAFSESYVEAVARHGAALVRLR